ncbi:MAG TPA: hypothetical protein VIS07_13475 [Candidatus Binatia bacterium]
MRRDACGVAVRFLAMVFGGAVLALLLGAGEVSARCGDLPGDDAAVAATRAAIEASCGCPTTAGSRSTYLRCAREVVKANVAQGTLPTSCRSSVMRCVNKSSCGRPGAVSCCRTNRQGKTTCTIVGNASRCKAPSGGSACVGQYASCCDACTATGCAPTPTPVPTPTPTPQPTQSPTPRPIPTLPPLPALCRPLIGLPELLKVPFTVVEGSPSCGGAAFDPPASPPFSGQVRDGSNAKIADLGEGCLYTGGLAPILIPAGSTAMLAVKGVGVLDVKLGGSSGSGPLDCTKGAGPGAHCLNGAPGTDGAGACTSDAHCGGAPGTCNYDANCFFGPPIPLTSFGAWVVNAFQTDLCGEVDLLTTRATFATTISARVYLTGNLTEPCPVCVNGQCSAGANAGGACTPVGAAGTSPDCPPADATFFGALTVPITQLGTGTSTITADAEGTFCEGQTAPGALGLPDARVVTESGAGFGSSGSLLGMRLAGTFCIPATGTLLDVLAGLPAVGAVSQRGALDLTQLLGLP